MTQWISICKIDDILPETGICALVGDNHVAIFRPNADNTLYAISNIDPFAQASVLSRGLIVEHQHELWVASPLKKQHFRLKDGYCLESQTHSVKSYIIRVHQNKVEIQI
ncbi:Nitrite reductase (NADH) small subunit [Commensalibacter sp. Nvir]|uniref:nitrite reductase small subunit NirD n=1 Tax=Commensalibacter sp. Nvir TaxID=3069817 RepID=UPI002D5BDDB9|nr:Nitrite reductase (NADH) small subunit [Commensalibacter sp. Nvir]